MSLTKFTITILIIGLFFITKSFPQNLNSIEGKVTDAKTKEPLPFVNVFLSYTTIGAVTNNLGKYKLSKMPPGKFLLTVSMVGYESKTFEVNIKSSSKETIDFELTEKPINVKEITVIGESAVEWQRRLRKFTKEFLGESSNADESEILNPEIIDFEIDESTNELIASAQDAIVIVNHALGYKIKAYLKDFAWSESGDNGRFQISPLFEELKSSDEKEKDIWEVNRMQAYQGSFRHFLKSCAEGKVYEEGFRLMKSNVDSRWIYSDKSNALLFQKKIDLDTMLYPRIKKSNQDEYNLLLDSLLQVIYVDLGEEPNYKSYRKRLNGFASAYLNISGFNLKGKKDFSEIMQYQNSWVILPSGKLLFNSNGICSDASPYGKKFAGYWAWKRVADLLPYDYKISLSDESGK